jgi:hypothetical protein
MFPGTPTFFLAAFWLLGTLKWFLGTEEALVRASPDTLLLGSISHEQGSPGKHVLGTVRS